MKPEEVKSGASRGEERQIWRSLEARELTPTQRAALQVEFEQRANVADWDPIDRRDFMRLMGSSLALAGP